MSLAWLYPAGFAALARFGGAGSFAQGEPREWPERLAELRDRGVLTESEFQTQKKRILDG